MHKFLSIGVLLLCGAGAAAETITTTDGAVYVRAADGHFYPAAHFRTVAPAPVASPPIRISPSYYWPAPAYPNGGCSNGKCYPVK